MTTVDVQSEEEHVDVKDVRTGRIFNIQRFSVQDGPGIRTAVFVKGCPLRCPWCCNPESQNTFLEVGHINSLCNQCGKCLEVCEPKAISILSDTEKGVQIDRDKCTNCGKCVPACVYNAMRLFGEELSLEELLDELSKDSLYYRNSGGGITVSGGEVLHRPKHTAAILKAAQEMGYHTAIETSGYGTSAAWDTVLEYLDLVLYDLKIMDPARHLEVTGVPNGPILANARKVRESGVPMIIRVPLIPTLTDTEENIREIARFVKELDPGLTVNLLPYHRFGMNKYNMLDREYKLPDLEPIPEEDLHDILSYFEASGLNCEIIR